MPESPSLLQCYRSFRDEVDTLLNQESLFILAYIETIAPTTLSELSTRLGMDIESVGSRCSTLRGAGMLDGGELDISVSERGGGLLRLFGGFEDIEVQSPSVVKPTELQDLQHSVDVHLLTAEAVGIGKELRDLFTSMAINANLAIDRLPENDPGTSRLRMEVSLSIVRALELTKRLFRMGVQDEKRRPEIDQSVFVAATPDGSSLGPSMQGSETILVVEDDDAVRELVSIALRTWGYTAPGAANGLEALQLIAKLSMAGTPVDLVLTDLQMPNINGRELYEMLRPARPDLKFLFISGYPDDSLESRFVRAEDLDFIVKPFSGDTVVSRVRKALDGIRTRTGGKIR